MTHGFVMLDDNIIASFELDADEKIKITLVNTFTSVSEMLEYSAEQGVSLSVMANAEFNDYAPKHIQEVD